jgi:hypothetical protein
VITPRWKRFLTSVFGEKSPPRNTGSDGKQSKQKENAKRSETSSIECSMELLFHNYRILIDSGNVEISTQDCEMYCELNSLKNKEEIEKKTCAVTNNEFNQ